MDENETVDLKVYDMPVELKNKYISMAKLDYDNELWKVLEAGMDRLMDERQTKMDGLEQDVESLQKQIVYLKTKIEQLEADEQQKTDQVGPATFGGSEPEETQEMSDEELLKKFK